MNADITASDLLGYMAAGLVLVTFLAQSMTTLRAIAIASNVMFIAYALLAWLPPVLVLHALLLPLNAWRLWQVARSSRARASASNRASCCEPRRWRRFMPACRRSRDPQPRAAHPGTEAARLNDRLSATRSVRCPRRSRR